jgi:hypothetical protein
VSSNLHDKDNEQFLDSFRYVIVRSHLLREPSGPGDRLRARSGLIKDLALPDIKDSREQAWSLDGTAITCSFAFSFALMTKWILTDSSLLSGFLKLILLGLIVYVGYEVVSASTGRQRLRSLRMKAIKAIESVLSNFEAFDSSSSAAINFIQEVEAVSRGYHL